MHRRIATSALSLLLASALVLAPMRGAMAANDDATITVWTKDGGMFRGEVVERVPNDHVTIKLATGETKRIEWKDVERDSIGVDENAKKKGDDDAQEEEESPRATPKPKAVQRYHEPDETRVHVTLLGADGERLERESGRARQWELVCRAPCGAMVDPGHGYRVTAAGHRPTETFKIDGHTKIKASLGSVGGTVAGWVSFGLGAGVLLTGVVVLASAPKVSDAATIGGTVEDPGKSARTTGLVLIGVGLAATVLGLVAVISNSSEYTFENDTSATRKRTSTFAFALTPTGFVF